MGRTICILETFRKLSKMWRSLRSRFTLSFHNVTHLLYAFTFCPYARLWTTLTNLHLPSDMIARRCWDVGAVFTKHWNSIDHFSWFRGKNQETVFFYLNCSDLLREKKSSDQEKLLKFEAEGWESVKILRSLKTFFFTVSQFNFDNKILFPDFFL